MVINSQRIVNLLNSQRIIDIAIISNRLLRALHARRVILEGLVLPTIKAGLLRGFHYIHALTVCMICYCKISPLLSYVFVL